MPESFRECGNGYYKEVPTNVWGFWHHWKFERAWYYYRAEGAGIPPDAAEQFHIPLSTLNQKIKRLSIEIHKKSRE